MSRLVLCIIVGIAAFAFLFGAFRYPAQPLALFAGATAFFFFAVATILIVFAAKLLIHAVIWLLIRTRRSGREDLLMTDVPAAGGSGREHQAVRLRANVQSAQRDEEALVKRYSLGRCAVEDVFRAKGLRLLAEIALLRHEAMPRSWAEECAMRRSIEQQAG